MGKDADPWLASLDEYKILQTYEKQKSHDKNQFEKAERTVRGDWKPRQKGRGDWICPRHECGNINFGYRDECNLCSEPRPKSNFFNIKGRFVRPSDTGGEIGEEASTKSGGLFSADDWICRCGNINWAKRNACHECGRSRVELAPRLGSRMADSEGKAIKNELLARAGDPDIENLAPEEFARVGRGRFAMTDPNAIYGGGSMAGSDRLGLPDASDTKKFNNMMAKSRGEVRSDHKMPGFHGHHYPGWEQEEEDFGAEAKEEVENENEIEGKLETDENRKMRDTLSRALKEEELKELKYKAERKAAAMGILWYETHETAEDFRNKERRAVEESNDNYIGRALPQRVERRYSSESEEEEDPKKPWDFKITNAKHRIDEKPDEVQEHEFFNLLDEKERKRLLEKKLEKNMKKIHKQIAKEKQRNDEKMKEVDAKNVKKEIKRAERERLREMGILGKEEGDIKVEPSDEPSMELSTEDDVKIPKVKKEPESDDEEDVDGVDMEDTQKLTSMRHQFIPGGLKEPEEREQVKIGLNFGGSKVTKRSNIRKAFTVKAKRTMF